MTDYWCYPTNTTLFGQVVAFLPCFMTMWSPLVYQKWSADCVTQYIQCLGTVWAMYQLSVWSMVLRWQLELFLWSQFYTWLQRTPKERTTSFMSTFVEPFQLLWLAVALKVMWLLLPSAAVMQVVLSSLDILHWCEHDLHVSMTYMRGNIYSKVLLTELAGMTNSMSALPLLGYCKLRHFLCAPCCGAPCNDTSSLSWHTSLITLARQSLSVSSGWLGPGCLSEPRSGRGVVSSQSPFSRCSSSSVIFEATIGASKSVRPVVSCSDCTNILVGTLPCFPPAFWVPSPTWSWQALLFPE